MTKYKESYKRLMKETDRAIQILIAAQRECEELFMEEDDDEFNEFDDDEE